MRQTYRDAMNFLEVNLTQLPWASREFYAHYLAQTFYFVRHSTRLLALASSRFDASKNDLHVRFLEHAREEKNHEVAAKSDLKNLGFALDLIPESAHTRALYATQYYNIEHRRPELFFAYILTLEGVAVEVYPKIYPGLESTYGKSCCKFLHLHVVEDPDHLEKAFEHIEALGPQICREIEDEIPISAAQYLDVVRRFEPKALKSAKADGQPAIDGAQRAQAAVGDRQAGQDHI